MSTAVARKPDSRAVLAKKKRRVFLDVLAKTGRVAEAARACGYTDTAGLQAYRRQDEDFAEALPKMKPQASCLPKPLSKDQAATGPHALPG